MMEGFLGALPDSDSNELESIGLWHISSTLLATLPPFLSFRMTLGSSVIILTIGLN
jgi:hypothetical protein